VARRFAAAYARWDAGQHGADVARSLARTATPQLLARVQAQQARPSARPVRPLRLTVTGVIRDAGSTYRVPLALEKSLAVHVATVVVTSTVNGPRVASLER
jgi:hypothetical protein